MCMINLPTITIQNTNSIVKYLLILFFHIFEIEFLTNIDPKSKYHGPREENMLLNFYVHKMWRYDYKVK